MTWYWAIFKVTHRGIDGQSRSAALDQDWRICANVANLFLSTFRESPSAIQPSTNELMAYTNRIHYGCDLGDVRIFCSFYAQIETEVHIARRASDIRPVTKETEERISALLDAIQRAHLSRRLKFITSLPKALRCLICRPKMRWPIEIRLNPLESTLISGDKKGSIAALNVSTLTIVAMGLVAALMSKQFGDDPWPLAFAPFWAGLAAFLVAIVWYAARGQYEWKIRD